MVRHCRNMKNSTGSKFTFVISLSEDLRRMSSFHCIVVSLQSQKGILRRYGPVGKWENDAPKKGSVKFSTSPIC